MIASTKIRVRYKDTDCMKVVYYGNYLTYFEVARVEFLRQHGHAMSEIDEKVRLPVVEASVRYHKPAVLDDLLEARCWIAERKRASFRFGYELLNEHGERVASGDTLHACWDPASNKMIGVPEWLIPVLGGPEIAPQTPHRSEAPRRSRGGPPAPDKPSHPREG